MNRERIIRRVMSKLGAKEVTPAEFNNKILPRFDREFMNRVKAGEKDIASWVVDFLDQFGLFEGSNIQHLPKFCISLSRKVLNPVTNVYAKQLQKVVEFIRFKFPKLKSELMAVNIPDYSKKYNIEQKPIVKKLSL